MSAKTEERIKALEVALNNELRERDFYLKHKERTINPIGKLMFASIASDEDEHYRRIQELQKKLSRDGKWPETIPLVVKGTEVKAIIQKLVDSVDTSSKADLDDMKAVKIAVDFTETEKKDTYTGKTLKDILREIKTITKQKSQSYTVNNDMFFI